MLGWLVDNILGPYIYDIFKPLIFKEGRFDIRRLLLIGLVILLGIAAYYIPLVLPSLAVGFGYFPDLKAIPSDSYVGRLQDGHYMLVNQYLFSFAYIAILLVLYSKNVTKKIATLLNDESHKVAVFARDVNLIDGSRCLNSEEKSRGLKKVAEKISQSNSLRFMVINGYHDLHDADSIIREEIEKKGRALQLKILLLDPFSEYANRRAVNLLPETDIELSRYRYIRDFKRSVEKVKSLNIHGAVDYRVYCSNPFFRFYLFDEDFVFQIYQQNEHGYQTPMYHFSYGPRSMFQFGQELFKYHWNKGFHFEKDFLHKMKTSFLMHLATMYGLYDESNEINKEGLINKIMEYVEEEFEKAEDFDKRGYFSGLDA